MKICFFSYLHKQNLQPLCRHVIRNQHKLMHFLQRQIRLSSSTSRPQEKQIDYDENVKAIDIPASAYQTQSQPISHDTDNGHLFKVNLTIYSITWGTSNYILCFVGIFRMFRHQIYMFDLQHQINFNRNQMLTI